MVFEGYYAIFYFFFLILITFYKGFGGLVYPSGVWGLELVSIFLFFFLQANRLDLGRRANRNEHTSATASFLVFTLAAIAGYVYFAMFTTYVLVIEIGFGLVGSFFAVMQLIFALASIPKFKKAQQI